MFSFYNILKSCNAVVLCNQCLSPLKLWVRTPFMAKCTPYNIMWWSLSVTCDRSVVSPGTPVSSTNKTGGHDIAEILLKVALNNINPNFVDKRHFFLQFSHHLHWRQGMQNFTINCACCIWVNIEMFCFFI